MVEGERRDDLPGDHRGRQGGDAELQAVFLPVAAQLKAAEEVIVRELILAQGKPVDIGGYYQPDEAKVSAALRPSRTLNDILAAI